MTVVPVEKLDEGLRELMDIAKRLGGDAGRIGTAESGSMISRLADMPDLSGSRLQRLQDLLDDEVVVSHEAVEGGVISPREEDREIAKSALAHLKLPQLRKMAGDLGLPKTGALDQLAERIVLAFRADQAEIAKLVIKYEEEPPPDRRLVVRSYPLSREVPEVTGPAAFLRRLVNRYIRVGIARWFVFDSSETIGGRTVRLDGTYRHYNADARVGQDDEYELLAEKRYDAARLWLRAGSPFVRVEAKGDAESRAIVTAFSYATTLRKIDIALDAAAIEGAAFQWSPKTSFMIDLLINKFRTENVEVINLTSAGFERAEDRSAKSRSESRPSVKSVRLQGVHILDSRPACELIVEGQGLVDLSLSVRFKPNREESFHLPLTVRLMRDHVVVSVGFDADNLTAARQLCDVVIDGVEQALRSWPKSAARLKAMSDEVYKRSRSEEPVQRADMFGPPADYVADD